MYFCSGQPMHYCSGVDKKLGMSEYAQRFAENGIDVSVLRYLTDRVGT